MKAQHHRVPLFLAHLSIAVFALGARAEADCPAARSDLPPYIEGSSDYADLHGCYSDTYESAWSRLPSGRGFAPGAPDGEWTSLVLPIKLSQADAEELVVEEDYPLLWYTRSSDDPDLHLTGDDIPPVSVEWIGNEPTTNASSVVRIQNKRHVVIEDIAIRQLGHKDHNSLGGLRTGKHSIFVDGCETLVVRNVYFSGPVAHSHLRVRGCRYIFIENVEVEGLPLAELLLDTARAGLGVGSVAGSGIFISNGNDSGSDCSEPGSGDISYFEDDFCDGSEACYANDLEWVVIQNSHVHDYTLNPDFDTVKNNHDGIAIESPADGIIFNTVVEDWWAGDALIDVGHRRGCDSDYVGHRFRVERNVLKGSPYEPSTVKTTGRWEPSDATESSGNAIVMANNFYKDLHIVDYHSDFPVYHVNESFYASEDADRKVWYKMEDYGPTFVENQFVRTPDGDVSMKIVTSNVLPPDPSSWEEEGFFFSARSNLYAVPDSTIVVRIKEWVEGSDPVYHYTTDFVEEWQGDAGQDEGSVLESDCLEMPARSNLCGADGLMTVDWTSGPGIDPALAVDRDFFGAVRGRRPTAGALEASSWRRIHRHGFGGDVGVELRRGELIGH